MGVGIGPAGAIGHGHHLITPSPFNLPSNPTPCARWRGPRRWMGQQMVGEVARGLSLFGGASSEVRRCNCSVVD